MHEFSNNVLKGFTSSAVLFAYISAFKMYVYKPITICCICKCVLLRFVDLYLTTLSLFHEQNAALLFHCIIVENKVFDQLKKALFLNKRSIKYLFVCLFVLNPNLHQARKSIALIDCATAAAYLFVILIYEMHFIFYVKSQLTFCHDGGALG